MSASGHPNGAPAAPANVPAAVPAASVPEGDVAGRLISIKHSTALLSLISAVFLLLGVAFNFGIFLPLDEQLVMYFSISDHIQTSVYVGMLLLTLPMLLMVTLFVVVVAGLVMRGIYYAGCFGKALSASSPSATNEAAAESGRWGRAKQQASEQCTALDQWVEDVLTKLRAISIYLLAILLSLLLLVLTRFAVPDEVADRYDGTVLLTAMGLISIAMAQFVSRFDERAVERREKSSRAAAGGAEISRLSILRHAAGGALLLVFAFQVGTFESIRAYRYLLSLSEGQHVLDGQESVHIIRSIDKGIFVARRPTDASTIGEIRFIPWSEIESAGRTLMPYSDSADDE